MTTRPLYPSGRLSAPIRKPGEHAGPPDYDLIARLRTVREQGDDAMTAVEQYDPDFSVKLSACTEITSAEQMLDEWLSRRLDVLRRTQSQLRDLWQSTRQSAGMDDHGPESSHQAHEPRGNLPNVSDGELTKASPASDESE